MKWWLLVVGLLFALVVEVEAQSTAVPAPTAAQIFAPGVEVLSETISPIPTPLPTSEGFPVSIFQQPTLSPDQLPKLPSGYQWSDVQPTESPDGRWLVGLAYADGMTTLVHALAYDRHNETFRDLGTITDGELKAWGEWYDQRLLLSTETMALHSSTKWFYMLDMQGETTEIGPITPPSQLLDLDPPELKVFWVEGADEQPSCRLSTYDISTGNVAEQDYGPYCFLEFQSQGVRNYYRVRSADGKQAMVARFDAETGTHVDLYSGEVEHIFWVSADERYAALALDTSGMIDILPGTGAFSNRYAKTQLTVVDLKTRQMLYAMTTTFDNVIGNWSASVFEIEADAVWVNSSSDPALGPNRFIRLVNGRAEADLVDAQLSIGLGGGWYIITPPGILAYQWVKLHNLYSQETVDVVDVSAFPQYVVGLNPLEGDTFEVMVQCCAIGPDYFQFEYEARYIIRVTGVETDA